MTDHNLTDDETVFGYRGQHHVKQAFRDMKDFCFIRFSPPFHRTDATIRVHAFHCVLARMLVSLLHRDVVTAGVAISQRRLLEQLKRIRAVTNYYAAHSGEAAGSGGRPRAERVPTLLSAQEEQIFRILELRRFEAG